MCLGAVIVSTPQDLALRDVVRGVDLFRKVNVPILGVIQNMSTFVCTNCGHEHDIFGLDGMLTTHGSLIPSNVTIGARRKCDELGMQLLGDIPLHPQICLDADAGKPTVVATPDSPQARAFMKIAERLHTELELG